MGFLDDVQESAGRALGAVQGMGQAQGEEVHRMFELNAFAASQGFPMGAIDPRFGAKYPDLYNEAQDITSRVGQVVGMTGAGAMNAANRAAAAAPGTLGQAAAAAGRAPQPGLPGMGSAPGSFPPAVPPPNTALGASALPGASRGAAVNPPSFQPPLPGINNPMPAPLQGPQLPPLQGPQLPPLQGPQLPPLQGPPAPASMIPQLTGTAAASNPGMLQNIVAWARANPAAAKAAGVGAGILAAAGIGAGVYTAGGTTPSAAATDPRDTGVLQAPGSELGIAEENARKKKRQDELDAMGPQQQAELDLTQQQAAYAKAQHDELERRMANSDMTDTQKEQARKDLETALHQMDNDASAARTQATEAGANARNAASEAGAMHRTEITESGANARNAATIAGNAADTATRETGANTRTGYEGQVTQRGQDIQARNAQLQFVTQQAANLVSRGQLSATKAHDMVTDYIATQKLPSEILKSVSDAITPMLPYMRNDAPGTVPPGFEQGGSYDQLAKMAGVKGHHAHAGYSDFNLMDLAAKYGGGAPTQPAAPIDVKGLYSQGPDTSEAAAAAYDQQNAAAAGGVPPMVQGLVQQAQQTTPPMPDDAMQRIYAGLGQQ